MTDHDFITTRILDDLLDLRVNVRNPASLHEADNNATAKDFASLLPLTLTLDDYNGTEKISDLPTKLSTRGAPEGVDPVARDLAYYAPWGNLAIFYTRLLVFARS